MQSPDKQLRRSHFHSQKQSVSGWALGAQCTSDDPQQTGSITDLLEFPVSQQLHVDQIKE